MCGRRIKKTLKAAEQNRPDVVLAREAWVHRAGVTETSRFVFIDESGATTTMTRLYGDSFDGARIYDRVPHGHWCTTTMVAAVGATGAKAPFVFDGAMDTEVFRASVEHVLAPELKAGAIVVLDNVSCHADVEARRLIEAAGARVWFMPPYSPDLNPIETNVVKGEGVTGILS